MSSPTNLQRLFADYASGEITDDDLRILEAALREDSDLRRDFVEYLNVDSALGDLAALSIAEIVELDATKPELFVTASPDRTARHRVRFIALAGAVAAMLLVAVSLWIASSYVEPVATLVASVDAALQTNDQKNIRVGTELPAGEYTLQRGLLHLEFGGGVKVYLEAPARFNAVSEKRIVLHSGRLTASVPPAGTGFTVETPQAEVVDFGTEFAVDVEMDSSEVHVFDGLVSVRPRTADNNAVPSIDLRTAQAVRIDKSRPQPVEIALASERFVRNFDEPLRSYPRSVKHLAPVAYYRMPIRDRGLVCEPSQYSGEVLTGDGERPPHAKGFIGGSLRVLAESTGRGGIVKAGPPLNIGQFTLIALVYAESLAPGGTVVTNLSEGDGNFALALDKDGFITATVRTAKGKLRSCIGMNRLSLKTWHQIVVTSDEDQLRLYEDGKLSAATDCSMLRHVDTGPIWFGTTRGGTGLWNGRIDEVALFDRAISSDEIAPLYKVFEEQLSKSR